MRFEAPLARGPLRRLDPRRTLLTTIAFVVVVVATPLGSWKLVAGEGLVLAFVIGLAGIEVGPLLRRWLAIVAVVAGLAVLIAVGHPLRDELGLAGVVFAIIAKNALAVLAMLTLAAVTPFPRLLDALARLRVPPVLVATLHFMYRYLHVLGEELDRMTKARRARSFRRVGAPDWGILSGLIGMLFLRSMERGERVHAAMLARGWDGTIRTLDGDDPA